MARPQEFFLEREPHQLARTSDPDTSHEAASYIISKLRELQRFVYIEILAADSYGMTDYELIERCNLKYGVRPESTYRKRRSELVELGLIKNAGRKRPTTGIRRIVWIAASVDNWMKT